MSMTRKWRLALPAAAVISAVSWVGAGAVFGAASSNWEVMLWTNPLTVSVDTASISPHAERFTARVLWDYAEPQTTQLLPATLYRSMIGLVVFDCATLRFGGAGSVDYTGDGGDGDPVSQYSIDPDKAPLTSSKPGTIGRDLATYVCAHVPRPLR
jgi:hypothetical protein